jgi:hypothetical protein
VEAACGAAKIGRDEWTLEMFLERWGGGSSFYGALRGAHVDMPETTRCNFFGGLKVSVTRGSRPRHYFRTQELSAV